MRLPSLHKVSCDASVAKATGATKPVPATVPRKE